MKRRYTPHRRGLALRRLAFLLAVLVAGGLLNRYHALPIMALRDVEELCNTGPLTLAVREKGPGRYRRLYLAGNENVVVLCAPQMGLRGWTVDEYQLTYCRAERGGALTAGQWELQGTLYVYGRLTDPRAASAQIVLCYEDREELGPVIGPENWTLRKDGRYFIQPVADMPERGWRDQRPEPQIAVYDSNGAELGRWGVAPGGMLYTVP